MADLRELLTSNGHTNVSTLGQSGNAVFTARGAAGAGLAREIEESIEGRLGFRVSVLVRTARELAIIVAGNPLPQAAADPSRFHVAFLSENPAGEHVASLDPSLFEPDQFRFADRAVYVWYRNGILESKLPYVWEKRLGVTSTSRNWNTVTRLAEMSAG